jgi:hypothetical protein
MPLSSAERQARYRAKMKGPPPVVPLGPPVLLLGPIVPVLLPTTNPAQPALLISVPLPLWLVLHVAPVVPLGPAVPIQPPAPPYNGLWDWDCVRDIKWADATIKAELWFKLRWSDRKRNGEPYKDSWVHEAAIPNKSVLFKWLRDNGPRDRVLCSWQSAWEQRERATFTVVN